MIAFITSKIGHLENISVFNYRFTDEILKQQEQHSKFKIWLNASQNDNLYEINATGFKTFRPLAEKSTWQYKLDTSTNILTPYSNTQKISKFISHQIRLSLSSKYQRFLNTNTFITSSVELEHFSLKKAIEFKVEVFPNGKLLINFLPVTKIISNQTINSSYLNTLKLQIKSGDDELFINLIDLKKFKKLRININASEDLEKAKLFIARNSDIIATFDYHFISSYSPEIFRKVSDETIKNIDKSVFYLQEKLEDIKFKESYNFQKKTFCKVELKKFGTTNNLIVGNNKFANKQSAAFYNGMYKPVDNAKLQPIFIDQYSDSNLFIDLLARFNQGGKNYEVFDPIYINSDESLNSLLPQYNKNTLFAIFTQNEQPRDFFKTLNNNKILFQIYLGSPDKHKLSNFAVKCLEKQGGMLSVIKEIGVKNHTYFIGIDLGHSHNGQFSHLALVYFDKNGKQLHSSVNKNLPLNEAITPESIWTCLFSFSKFLRENNLPKPEKIIIHRDGKLHLNDIEIISKQIKKHLNTENIEVVEIIKNGFPIFACFDTGAYINLDSGDSYIDHDNKYALLITNTQADQKNAIINPIIIKHKLGVLPMETIVEQVYWFTKIYTNNLYQSTRLPATTLKANNIVGTSIKVHQSTYRG